MAEPKLDIAWQKDAQRLDVAAGYITLLCESKTQAGWARLAMVNDP